MGKQNIRPLRNPFIIVEPFFVLENLIKYELTLQLHKKNYFLKNYY